MPKRRTEKNDTSAPLTPKSAPPSSRKPNAILGERLRHFRRKKGWSQLRLATELNMKQQLVSSMEASGDIPITCLTRLARHGLDVQQFVSDQSGERSAQRDPVSESLELFHNLHTRGIVDVHDTRAEGLQKLKQYIQSEEVGIDITGSSLLGLARYSRDVWEEIIKRVADVPEFVLRILLTHPALAVLRAFVEGRTSERIRQEINEAMENFEKDLKAIAPERVHARVALHPPTVFAVFVVGQGIALVNPYTFTTEAFNTASLIIRDTETDAETCMYRQYHKHHFADAWEDPQRREQRVSIEINELQDNDALTKACDELAEALKPYAGRGWA